jgi:potassium inwardly-rectifying channel subfamily J
MATNNHSNTKYETVNINDDIKIPDWSINNKFRFVDKNGHININYSSLGRVKNMHSNIILFIMQAEWWLVLTAVLFSFIFSWFFFAFLYFLVSIEHGDFVLNEDEQIDNQTNSTRQVFVTEREKCVQDVHNFLSALLFSIETQQSIGYGSRYITTECMGGILVLTLQSSLGYILQVIVTQIVFTKLSRPTGEEYFVFRLMIYLFSFRKISICCI